MATTSAPFVDPGLGAAERSKSKVKSQKSKVSFGQSFACRGGAWAGLLLVAGCGGSTTGPALEPVAGRVSFYGRPVVAEVLFQPIKVGGAPAGRPSIGRSDATGRYQAMFAADRAGVVPGPNRVTVTVFPFAEEGEPQSMDDATRPFKRVVFERTIAAGGDAIDFLLTY